jgi:drug/metabolite transporter (DMT)-like permease
MQVLGAYLGVIAIWATTPLTIQWGAQGAGPLFAVTARMLVGAALALVVVGALRAPLPRTRRAIHTYLAAGFGIFASMSATYWAAVQVPSGLISVVFGLSPLVTGLLAAPWLGERLLTPGRLSGVALGGLGLAVVFGPQASLQDATVRGLLALLLAVVTHSTAAVWVKRVGADVPALATNTGALLVAAPLLVLSWLVLDGELPGELPPRASLAILYTGVFGSVLGFSLYFFVLKRLEATRVALITLVTPVLALLLGSWLNGEPVLPRVWVGALIIGLGLLLFEAGGGARRGVAPVRASARLLLERGKP